MTKIETPAGMTAYMVAMKVDYRQVERLVHAKNEKAAANKAARIWPCDKVLAVRIA